MFEAIKLIRAWAGHYDYNVLDQNVLIGPAPQVPNFFFANGFSGHGLQHAPAAGRGVAERLLHGRYLSLDLGALDPARVAAGRPLVEQAVI